MHDARPQQQSDVSRIDFRGLKPELLLTRHWKELSVPTTLVIGDQDAFGGFEEARAAARDNERIRLVRIVNAGHAPWFDEPVEVAQAIERALD